MLKFLTAITFIFAISQSAYSATASFTTDAKAIVESSEWGYNFFDASGDLKSSIKRKLGDNNSFCRLAGSRIIFETSEDSTFSVTLYDADTSSVANVINYPIFIRSMACSASGNFFALGTDDSKINIYSGSSGSLIKTIVLNGGYIKELAITSDNQKLAVISDIGWDVLSVFDLTTGKSQSEIQLPSLVDLNKLPKPVTSFQYSPDGKFLAWNFVISTDEQKIVFEPSTSSPDLQDYFYSFVPSSSALLVVHTDYKSGSRDVTAYSTSNWNQVWSKQEYGIGVTNEVAFSDDGKFYALGTLDGIKVYSTDKGEQIGEDIHISDGGGNPIIFSPNSGSLAIKDGDRYIIVPTH